MNVFLLVFVNKPPLKAKPCQVVLLAFILCCVFLCPTQQKNSARSEHARCIPQANEDEKEF